MLEMSIFNHRFHDRFFLRHLVMLWSATAAEEAWVQGQILRYPGWYSQLMYITYPIALLHSPNQPILNKTWTFAAFYSFWIRFVVDFDESLRLW